MKEPSIICPKCGETNVGAHIQACAYCGEDLYFVRDEFSPSLKLIMWLSFLVGFAFFIMAASIITSGQNYYPYLVIYVPGIINLVIGWGIWKRKYWARRLAIVVWTIILILNVLSFSILHIALGLFILFALQSPEAKMFFRNAKVKK